MKYFIISTLILLTACTTSIHPFVTEETTIIENKLYGEWKKDTLTVTIENFLKSPNRSTPFGGDNLLHPKTSQEKKDAVNAAKKYLITFLEIDEDFAAKMEGRLTKINGALYLELRVHDVPAMNYGISYTIAKINIEDRRLTLRFMDGRKIKDMVLSGRVKIKHEHEKFFDTFVLSASTKDLRMFLEKYGNDESLYSKDNIITLTKKS
jgi:hypothetical protein